MSLSSTTIPSPTKPPERHIFHSQVVTEYGDAELDSVLEACERMNNHLTAAVVSNDVSFQRKVLEATVNGTTYCGIRARWVWVLGRAVDRLPWTCHKVVCS